MAVRPIDANAMLNELRPVNFEAEHSAVLLSDVSKMMREWVERQPTLTPPNEPLTLEQLLEMDGEPVYVVPKDKPAHCGGWCGVTVWKCDRYSYVSLLRDADSGWGFEKYGKTWIAYRRPPEGEEK